MGDYDEIRLTGLGGYGYHGVLASEREEGQPFHVDLVLYTDTARAARSDELTDTIDYAAVSTAVVAIIEGEPVNLIETLAARIADGVLEFGVQRVEVTVHKPGAPIGVPFTDVQVRISRSAPSAAGAEDAPAVVAAHEPAPHSASPALAQPSTGSAALGAMAPLGTVPPVEFMADNEGVPGAQPERPGPDLEAAPEAEVPIVLGLGGNLGDVRGTLRSAVEALHGTPGIRVQEVSGLARTAPVLHEDAVAQDDYLNAVVLATTTLSPRDLLTAAHEIEDDHGRVRVQRWGDRTLDIDIITYGELHSEDPELTLPHPLAARRAFVLVPWAQVEPDAVLPGDDGGPVADLADRAPDRDGVRWLALDWLAEPVAPTKLSPTVKPPAEPPAEAADSPAEPPADSPAPTRRERSSSDPWPETPSVAEWLGDESAPAAPPVVPAQPAAPAQPVAPLLPVEPAEGPAPAADPGPQQQEDTGDAGAIDWLADEPPAPPLSAAPQWSKVRPEE